MLIVYESWDGFYDGVKALVERGLMFEANHTKLTIKLSGGF